MVFKKAQNPAVPFPPSEAIWAFQNLQQQPCEIVTATCKDLHVGFDLFFLFGLRSFAQLFFRSGSIEINGTDSQIRLRVQC